MRHQAILLPGIVTPAEIAYGRLRENLDEPEKILLRDLAIYDTDEPPVHHRLETEINAVLAAADAAGLERFNLMGFSAGGAVAAAFAAANGERLASLCLLEPAWLGNADQTEEELRLRKREAAASDLPLEQSMAEFVRLD